LNVEYTEFLQKIVSEYLLIEFQFYPDRTVGIE